MSASFFGMCTVPRAEASGAAPGQAMGSTTENAADISTRGFLTAAQEGAVQYQLSRGDACCCPGARLPAGFGYDLSVKSQVQSFL